MRERARAIHRWTLEHANMRMELAIAFLRIAAAAPVGQRAMFLRTVHLHLRAARPPLWRPILRWRWERVARGFEDVVMGREAKPGAFEWPTARVVRR